MNLPQAKQFTDDVEPLIPDQMRIDADRLAAVFAKARLAAKKVAADSVTDADRERFCRLMASYNRLKTEFSAKHKIDFDTADLGILTNELETM